MHFSSYEKNWNMQFSQASKRSSSSLVSDVIYLNVVKFTYDETNGFTQRGYPYR